MLSYTLFIVALLPLLTGAAPVSCDFACPAADDTGHSLITSRYATSYTGPYSIFDCIYSRPASPTGPHICHYYKSDGNRALGSSIGPCPPHAVSCSSVESPQFSAPEKVEIVTWIETGNDLLYYKGHPS